MQKVGKPEKKQGGEGDDPGLRTPDENELVSYGTEHGEDRHCPVFAAVEILFLSDY